MRLAIGDVVRDRTDMALGTVARIDINADRRVVVNISGGLSRPVPADDLEIVSRHTRPATNRFHVVAISFFLIALLAAYIAGHSVQSLGGSWLLTLMASVGAYELFESGFRCYRRLTGPRRFRI